MCEATVQKNGQPTDQGAPPYGQRLSCISVPVGAHYEGAAPPAPKLGTMPHDIHRVLKKDDPSTPSSHKTCTADVHKQNSLHSQKLPVTKPQGLLLSQTLINGTLYNPEAQCVVIFLIERIYDA